MSDMPQEKQETSVHKSIKINRPAEMLYNYWRVLENLPDVMSYVRSVSEIDSNRSHWVAEIAGIDMEWDAEIEYDEPGRKISWHTEEHSDLSHHGSVSFIADGPMATEVVVEIAGRLTGASMPPGSKGFASFLAGQEIENDLKNFKEKMESQTYRPKAA
jgi:uncharacterized membrane protein